MTHSVAIVGAGALGQVYAAQLANARRPVTLLTRQPSFERLARGGSVRLRGILEMHVPLHILDGRPPPAGAIGLTADPARIAPGSGLVFATKAHQLGEAVEAVRTAETHWSAPAAWVLGIQNGLQKDDVLADAFGVHRVIGAVTILAAQHADDGSVVVTGPGPTYLGELAADRRTAEYTRQAVELLSAAGVPVQREADVRVVLWSKAANAAGVFGVCVLARCSGLRMSGTPPLTRAFLALVRETAELAGAYGVRVADFPGFPMRTYTERADEETVAALAARAAELSASGAPENFPSMVQDVLAGRPLEVEGVFGDLVERAARRQVGVPRLTFVRDILRGINGRG
ncbi:MAG TPA: 2-dehydropantoate 2-reductase [Chloroflexota bacterium]